MSDPFESLRAALADRYRIERVLGRGGMGTVLLAEDLRHRRRVAIKVLAPELAAVLGPERFLREIEIAARLQHPHILPLLDSGTAGDLFFYLMPYVAGESLRDRLDRERQLPVEDAIRLTCELARALDYAHRQEVVHRDIKPENILLEEGHAVVADFGIARALEAACGPQATPTGAVLGTPVYMSPEQAIGSRQVDGRSDLYSLGCTLYEMLAGQPPFVGATAESVVHQHLSVAPRMVTELRLAVPAKVAEVLARTLAKAPADRFSTTGSFASALESALGVMAPSRRESDSALGSTVDMRAAARRPSAAARRWYVAAGAAVVVLASALLVVQNWEELATLLHIGPTPALGSDPAWVLVADFEGPADEPDLAPTVRELVMAGLDQSRIVASVPDVQIRAVLELAGRPESTRVTPKLAQELAVRNSIRAVLEGRVGRAGPGRTVVVRVVDVEDGATVLTASAAAKDEGSLIPSVGRLARELREGLGERRKAIESTRLLNQVATPSFEAYQKYVRARDIFIYGGGDPIQLWRQALALDPDFSMARGMMGIEFGNRGMIDSARVAYTQALAHPERLTEFRRNDFEAQLAVANDKLPAAAAIYERALRQKLPVADLAVLYNNQGELLRAAGRQQDALECFERAEKLWPAAPNGLFLLNQVRELVLLGRSREAQPIIARMSPRLARWTGLQVALAERNWAVVDSLGGALAADPTVDTYWRTVATVVMASADASRGGVHAAARRLEQAQAVAESARALAAANYAHRARTLLAMVSSMALPPPRSWIASDTSVTAIHGRSMDAAVAGDTTLARRLLRAAQRRSMEFQQRGPTATPLVEGMIAARTGRWEEVVRIYGGPARVINKRDPPQVAEPRVTQMRWYVADAYEHLGRPDSAAAYLERMTPLVSVEWAPQDLELARGITNSFVHRRLVLLYSHMGRLAEARRHWEIFSHSLASPDPVMVALADEARGALSSAEAVARAARQ